MKQLNMGNCSELKRFSLADILSWKPAYDFRLHLSPTWQGTAVDILNNSAIPFPERLWVVCRPGVVSERVVRLFAVWCARQIQDLMNDERSTQALEVAEQYANGEATLVSLREARYSAYQAVCAVDFEVEDSTPPRGAEENAARAAAWLLAESSIFSAIRAIARACMSAQASAHGNDRISLINAQRDRLIGIISEELK